LGKSISHFLYLVFFLSLSTCAAHAAQQSTSDFYEGLKKRQEGHQSAVACFEKALNADNPAIAAAAAAELMSVFAAGGELSEATMAAIRQKAALSTTGGSWALALEATTEAFLALLLNGDSRSLNEAAVYALEQWRSEENAAGISLTPAEAALVNGRDAVSRSRYSEALLFFRIALRDSPDLFFRYPDLVTDLGRAYQYTPTGREGVDYFLQWEKAFDDKTEETLVRFRLLFFAARIARQHAVMPAEKNIELFEQALPFALEISPEQSDACIWYILDSSLSLGTAATIQYLEKYVSQWHDDSYFSDVLDKLARELILKRQWEDMAAVCAILEPRHSGAGSTLLAAKYAWIISRAIDEGILSLENNNLKTAALYRRIAYDAGGGNAAGANTPGGLYYRSLSAAALNEPFLVLPAAEPQPKPKATRSRTAATAAAATAAAEKPTPVMEFLMGFFEHHAAAFAPKYIKPLENDLGADELRRLAEALGAAGQHQESMRLAALYTRRNGHQMSRQDWELLYPRPFKELVERYAQETGIEPARLYALIRTESAFNHTIVSRAGAIGLTQLMPATAREMAARIRRQGGPDYIPESDETAPNLRDPAVNIHIGAAYLAYLDERMEDPMLALLAYNGGMNRVRRWRRSGSQLPAALPVDLFLETIEYDETRNYGRRVMGAAALYKELYYTNQ